MTYELMKDVVRNGSNLTIVGSIPYSLIRELAALARGSGASITVNADKLPYELTRELSGYGSTMTFVNGLREYETGK
jgi:hypothetical protein